MKVTADRPVRVRILDENGGLRDMPDILADLRARYGETLDAFEAAEIKEAFGTDEAMKMINALYAQEAAVRANADALGDAAQQGSEFTSAMAAAADNNWDATMVLMSQKMDVISWSWSSPGLMDTFSLMKESVFHAENEEPVPCGIQGSDGRAGAHWAQC